MSTSGCVAVRKGDGWRGVYNHFDSYPTGLGSKVWEKLQKVNLSEFSETLLNFTDWRDYLNGGACKYCGKKGLGQPHSIGAEIMGFDSDVGADPDPEIRKNLLLTGYPDPEAELHSHDLDGNRSVEDLHLTSERPDPLFLEWVYVVDPDEQTLEVLTNRGEPGEGKRVDEPFLRGDGYWEYGHCAYRHARIALVNLGGPEPDWRLIQDLDRAVAVPDESPGAERVSERLKHGPEAKECPVCGDPVPDARSYPDLEDQTVGHESCVRKKLEDLGAEVGACLTEPRDPR